MEYCQDYYDVDGYCSFDCELPLNHDGDHEFTLTWPRREPSPPAEPTPMTEAIQRIWGPEILNQLRPYVFSTVRDLEAYEAPWVEACAEKIEKWRPAFEQAAESAAQLAAADESKEPQT